MNSKMECHLVPEWRWMKPLRAWWQSYLCTGWKIISNQGRNLDFAAENDIMQLCLPSDTTHYLKPLFRSLFKPLTTFWQQAVNNWIHNNPSRKITRLQFGRLLAVAWNQAATAGNGSAGFSACGIYPYDPYN